MKRSIKPFDKVLVRDSDANAWGADFYAYSIGETHFGIGKMPWKQCIPYEGNELLLGTTDSPEPELKKGDAVLVWDKGDYHKKIRIYSRYDSIYHRHVVLDCFFSNKSADEYMYDFAEKFVPMSVES